MFQRKPAIITFFLLALSLGLLWLGWESGKENTQQYNLTLEEPTPTIEVTDPVNQETGVFVTRVVDGDTIEIEGGQKVRYIGIDTPETVDPRRAVGCFGKEASNKNKELVEGKMVILEKDITNVDKYGRLLRYVYLKQADGTLLFVNDYLVREGYAKNYTYPPDVKFNAQFLEAEREAREQNRGLWNKCAS
ncbi:MAG: thermonuclease family protein [Candidatus Daviesbacteria bacterium]|nr:thermonuclease family protein [Candidatus Daviesbacteria bacterium]